MDCISVVDLEVFAYHGVLEEEKEKGQVFLVSFDVFLEIREAAKKDDLNLSISYADMCKLVKKYMTNKTYNLIETVTVGIADVLLETFQEIEKVKVTLKKPSAPIGEPVAYPAISIERSWHQVFISVGSNLGDSKGIIEDAIRDIGDHKKNRMIKVSRLVKTKPWGGVEQEDFLNGAFEMKTRMNPDELMDYLLDIEKKYDRERKVKWGPRTLDLDILLYDDIITDNEKCIIPHPLMEKRLFVLEPLCEIAPYKVHPILNKRINEIKDLLIKSE